MHNEYIKVTEELAVELGREPTSEEIAEKIFDMLAETIDEIYASRQEANFVGLPEGSIGGQAMKKANVAIKANKEISGEKRGNYE